MKIRTEIDEAKLKSLVLDYLENILTIGLKSEDVEIEVKSKLNYKSEWEKAEFRAVYQREA